MTIDNYPFIQCLYCDARISSKYPHLYYHAYKKHPEKIREVFENGFRLIPLDIPKLMSKERAYRIFLKTWEEIDQREMELR
jgi:hypothetical protein